MTYRFAVLAVLLALPSWAQKTPFDVQALVSLQRISDPQVSRDGTTVAFVVKLLDAERNTTSEQIYTVPVGGGSPRRLTWLGEHNFRPRWSPDSRSLAFLSDRSGSMQVWTMQSDGGTPQQVTNVATGADGVLYSPDGQTLVFTSEVFPDCFDMACNARRLEAAGTSQTQVREYGELLFRHWNRWEDGRRRHILAIPRAGGEPLDLTPGATDVPPLSVQDPDDYAISPDGKELCYAAKTDPQAATSTNSDLFVVPIAWGLTEAARTPVRLTTTPGAEKTPRYSPDGNYLAWRSQMRGGYESDRWRLTVMRRKPAELQEAAADQPAQPGRALESPPGDLASPEWDPESVAILTDGLDRPVDEFTWSPESTRLFFTTSDRGRRAIQLISVAGGEVRITVTGSGSLGDPQFTPDGRTMVYTEQSGSRPVEIFAASASGGAPKQLTSMNSTVLDRYELAPYEEFRVEGAGQAPVHSFLVKPPNFQIGERYPVLFLIHGGPQGAWGQEWSYRWNAQVFAAAGYVVVMPNVRGSIGYGQRFTDEINGEWGGRSYDDLMAVVNHVSGLPYVMPDRMAAAGASYGGYMVNWMMGRTQRFRAFVSHGGVFDTASWAMETEELWFPMWEFHGMPWEQPDLYRMWTPSRFISDFFTPTLVTHGEQDYRVPYGQAIQLFSALQKQQVESKLLLFPDEGHWILKPRNSVRWYNEVIAWLDYYVKPPADTPASFPATPGGGVVQ